MTSPMSPAERAALPLSKTARDQAMAQLKKPLPDWWSQEAATNVVTFWRDIAERLDATLRAAEARAQKAEAERDEGSEYHV